MINAGHYRFKCSSGGGEWLNICIAWHLVVSFFSIDLLLSKWIFFHIYFEFRAFLKNISELLTIKKYFVKKILSR